MKIWKFQFLTKPRPSSGDRSDELSAHRDIPPSPTFLIYTNKPMVWSCSTIQVQAFTTPINAGAWLLLSLLSHCMFILRCLKTNSILWFVVSIINQLTYHWRLNRLTQTIPALPSNTHSLTLNSPLKAVFPFGEHSSGSDSTHL